MNRFQTICEEIETSAKWEAEYFAFNVMADMTPLEGVFVKAKTACGALLKIFRYMQEHQINQIYGLMSGKPIQNPEDLLGGYDYNPDDSDNVIDICEEWRNDNLLTLSRVIIA